MLLAHCAPLLRLVHGFMGPVHHLFHSKIIRIPLLSQESCTEAFGFQLNSDLAPILNFI
jgi:hypothetical protein